MANSMDRMFSNNVPNAAPMNIQQAYQAAMQNPQAFREMIMRNNPQAYQRAMQIMQSGNPQQAVMQMLQARGLNPAMFNLPIF